MVEVIRRARVVPNRVLELSKFVQQRDLVVCDLRRSAPSTSSAATYAVVVLEVREVVQLVLAEGGHDFRVRDDLHDLLRLALQLVKRGQHGRLARLVLCSRQLVRRTKKAHPAAPAHSHPSRRRARA